MSEIKVINDIKKKIEREKNIINSSTKIRENTENVTVKAKCNSNIREAQQNLEYLARTLEGLSLGDQGRGGGDDDGAAGKQPTFTRLDLLKYDCPSLGHRIQFMLQLLEFKLQIENQYKEASEKMIRLYQHDSDKHLSSAALGGRIESNKKIPLLSRGMKRYRDMHIDIADVREETELLNSQRLRTKPLTGLISIGISNLKDVDHMVTSSKLSKKTESVIFIKFDDGPGIRSKPFKNGKLNEPLQFELEIERKNEIEISICDKINGDHYVPVAIVWFQIDDIIEEVRRKRKNFENANNGWYSASKIQQQSQEPAASHGHKNGGGLSVSGHDFTISPGQAPSKAPANITSKAWYILEPAGQMLLTFGFQKHDRKHGTEGGNSDLGGLGRHGAIREKKDQVFEQHGHHFVQKNFYNIMMCAYCGEFARYSCYQCQDCRFLCHKKCYQNVVTKCISRSSNEADPNEAKLNHKIPHRFEPVSNRGTKWCCHCGFVLPWGKRNVRKCTICGIMCHSQCAHLVPNFCGMSMQTATTIFNTIVESGSKTGSPVVGKHMEKQLLNGPPRSSFDEGVPSPMHNTFGQPQAQPQPYHHHQQQQQFNNHMALPVIKVDNDYDKEMDHNPQYAESASSSNFPNPFDNEYNAVPEPDQKYYDDYSQENTSKRLSRHEDEPARESVPPLSLDPGKRLRLEQERLARVEELKMQQLQQEQLQQQQQQQQYQPDSEPEMEDARISTERSSHERHHRRRRIGLDDFQFLAVLGKGNFGKVMLAESRQSKNLCAIKVLKKDFIIEHDEVDSTKSEKRVFLIANKKRHPFLINLHCCFQTANRIYFVMEYVSGGDLMWHIQKERFSQRRAQFYAAEVLLGLKYFHDNGVVYRDLKLDNILLTVQGHIKIADYGLCKEEMFHGDTTSTFCGTPEFMAPEILQYAPYGKAVDWWAFGVLLYQMLLRQSPFRGDGDGDEDEIFEAILNDEPLYPINMPRESVEILQKLLTRLPAHRLGSGKRDAEEVMMHPYFRNINFDDILHLRVDPPYLPLVSGEHDVSNFDDEFTAETPRLTPINSTLDSSMQEKFRGFSHMSDDYI